MRLLFVAILAFLPVSALAAEYSFTGKFKSTDVPAALKDISLEIAEGEMLALFGEAGTGKSTLLVRVRGQILNPVNTPLEVWVIDQANRKFVEFIVPGGMNLELLPKPAISLAGLRLDVGGTLLDPVNDTSSAGPFALGMSIMDRIIARMGPNAPAPLNREKVLADMTFQLSSGLRQRVEIARPVGFDPIVLLADEADVNLEADDQVSSGGGGVKGQVAGEASLEENATTKADAAVGTSN